MAFVNLPPNLQDIFYSITDRVAKLETGPNMAMYYAEAAQGSAQSATAIALSAQSVATQAQVQAISAGIQANNAASQATIAQSQATIASSQATAAQVTANGKNKVYYSTSAPGATANTVGDIWYQYGTTGTYANKVIAQYSGAGGTSWTSVTVSGLIIANIDAGSITTGTLSAITISAGSGANSFYVSPSGVMSAQGAYIKGNITADSGTFNGTVNAATGYFGNYSGGNYWSIGASGLTAVGSGTITGGLIQGSSITVPNSSAWKFAVDSAGSLQAVNANITGTIYASGGTIGGFNIYSTYFGTGSLTIDSAGTITGGNSNTIYYGYANIGGGSAGSERLIVTGNSSFNGETIASGNVTSQTHFYTPFATTTTTAANAFINTGSTPAGRLMRSTASSQRYKENITMLVSVPELDPKKLLDLPVRAFTFKEGYLPEDDDRYGIMVPGFIAEEVDSIYPVAADYVENVETWNDRMIVPAMLALIQDQEKRITQLEGK